MDNLKILLNNFLDKPEVYWNGNRRQIKKTVNRSSNVADFYGWSKKDLVFYSLAAAENRISKKNKTIFISSYGSSGSHLLQNIILDIKRSIPLGEVYIAPRLIDEVEVLNFSDKVKFMEAYHLIHCGKPGNFFCNGPIINTVHKANLKYYSDWTNCYTSCFLFRNPVDLVISRTFRKKEYRDYLYPCGVSDEFYLDENIKKTKRFYNSALRFPYDEKIRFEDVVHNNSYFHAGLSNLIDVNDVNDLPFLIDRSINNGEKTNKFVGEREEVLQEYVLEVKNEMADIVLKLGY